MLNIMVFFSNLRYRLLESIWEGILIGFKVFPTMLKLTIAVVVQGLPIIINDEVGYIDAVC